MNKKIFYLFVLLLGLMLYGFFNFGNYLDMTEKPVKSDLIVCLGGGKDLIRIKKSLELYRTGYARKDILLVTGGTEYTIKDSNADDRMAYLNKQKDNISVVYNPYTKNTAEEILFIKNYMKEYDCRTVLVVTDPSHARRIRMLAEILAPKQDMDMVIVNTEPQWWDSKTYYLHSYARYMALSEFIKIPYNYLVYGVLGKLGYLTDIDDLEEKFGIRENFNQFIQTNVQETKK